MARPGTKHRVRQGECIDSIAAEVGHLPESIWSHPSNSGLRTRRRNRNLLLPGDLVEIPELDQGSEEIATGKRHRFRLKSAMTTIKLRIVGPPFGALVDEDDLHGEEDDGDDHEAEAAPLVPRANLPFSAEGDGITFEGETDGDGCLELSISAHTKLLRLRVGEFPDIEEFPVDLGAVDPADEVSGVQERLNNLGYRAGPADGIAGPVTKAALRKFQIDADIEATGNIDSTTRDALVSAHGS